MYGRILVADDEECIRLTFQNILHNAGHKVEVADTMSNCIKKMQRNPFDILFLDISFGADDSFESIHALKTLQPDCNIVIITGNPSLQSIVEAKRLGVIDYLAKPVREASLLYNVKKILSH